MPKARGPIRAADTFAGEWARKTGNLQAPSAWPWQPSRFESTHVLCVERVKHRDPRKEARARAGKEKLKNDATSAFAALRLHREQIPSLLLVFHQQKRTKGATFPGSGTGLSDDVVSAETHIVARANQLSKATIGCPWQQSATVLVNKNALQPPGLIRRFQHPGASIAPISILLPLPSVKSCSWNPEQF